MPNYFLQFESVHPVSSLIIILSVTSLFFRMGMQGAQSNYTILILSKEIRTKLMDGGHFYKVPSFGVALSSGLEWHDLIVVTF